MLVSYMVTMSQGASVLTFVCRVKGFMVTVSYMVAKSMS